MAMIWFSKSIWEFLMFLEVKDDTFEKHQNRQNSNNSGVFYMHGGMLKVHTYM